MHYCLLSTKHTVFALFLQEEPAASVNHSTPVPGRIKGQNMLRASSLAKPQRLQLLVPQKTSPSHSKLKCSQPCQLHTLPVPVPGPAIPMQWLSITRYSLKLSSILPSASTHCNLPHQPGYR